MRSVGTPERRPRNVEQPEDDLDALLYGVDLVWTGTDFGETPLGDLGTVQGVENARGAVERRLASEEDLPWRAGAYGPHARDYVDGPQKNATTTPRVDHPSSPAR